MPTFTGTVRQSDLEGGVTQLETADGRVFELEGAVGAEWVGRRVVIEGSVDKTAMSFTMTGPRLVVKSIRAAG